MPNEEQKSKQNNANTRHHLDNLARDYAALTLSDSIITKVLAVSEVAQMARIETLLREYITAAWEKRAERAIKQATTQAKQLKPASQIAASINKHMRTWDKEILPAFLIEMEKTYKLARTIAHKKATRQTTAALKYPIKERPDTKEPIKKAKTAARIRPSFDLADEQAIDAFQQQQVLWIGDHYRRRVSTTIAETTRDVMAKAGRDRSVAGALMSEKIRDTLSHVKVPGAFHGTSRQYFEGLVANAMTVARVHGQIRSFMEIGITTYTISNPGDKRTCDRCGHMDGKTFKTSQGANQMQSEIGAKTPDQVKAVHPWMSEKQLKDIAPTAGHVGGKAGEAQAKAYADKGQALPPYHFKCRCTVDIGTDSKTYESLQPLTPPIPGKPIVPKVPIGPPRAPTVGAWAKGLGEREKESFEAWSGGGYRYVRRLQRGKPLLVEGIQANVEKILKDMEAAISRAPYYQGVVYRGLSDLDPKVAKAIIKKGNTMTQDAFASWTKSSKVAEGFADVTSPKSKRFVIMEVKSKKLGHDISNVVSEGMKTEQEVLVGKGKKLRVVSSKLIEGRFTKGYHVVLEEVE